MKITLPGRVHEHVGHPPSFILAGIDRPQEHTVGRGYQAVYPDVTTRQAEIIVAKLRDAADDLSQHGGTYNTMLANDCADAIARVYTHLVDEVLAV